MNDAYVFDAGALVAFLCSGPGHQYVESLLDDAASDGAEGYLSELTASEVYYLVARFEGEDGTPTPESLRAADRDVRALTRRSVALARADWRLAGEIKAHGDISLADAHAVALAHERKATLVGGDDDFDTLPVGIDIDRFRDHAV
jgi:predicted nucleic acid-binding protein